MKLANEETFGVVIEEQVGESIDIKEIEKALDQAYKDVRQAQGRQHKLEIEQDKLDVTSKHYDRMYESINRSGLSLYKNVSEGTSNPVIHISTTITIRKFDFSCLNDASSSSRM